MIGRSSLLFSVVWPWRLIAAKPAPTRRAQPPMLERRCAAGGRRRPVEQADPRARTGGTVVIMLRPDAAPQHVERIKTLVRQGFYNGLSFHRVVPGFMAQGGDPKGTGEGGSTLPDLKAEFNTLPFLRGTVGAARADEPDTRQQPVLHHVRAATRSLDNKYTVIRAG